MKTLFKKFTALTLCCGLLSMALVFGMDIEHASASGTVTLGNFDLVDSGKHLDYGGSTNYLFYFTEAVNIWNSYKSGVVRKDTWNRVQDVKLSDVSGDKTTIVTITSAGKIKFNQNVMDTHTDNQKINDCLFALGGALGLGTTTNSKDVMFKHISSVISLSVNDKASYDSAYNNY